MIDPEFHGDGSSLTIEQTNAIRITLGLAPLTDESDKTEVVQDFVHQPAKNIGHKKREEKKLNALREHREHREIIQDLKKYKNISEHEAPVLDYDLLSKKAEEARKKQEMELSDEEDNQGPVEPSPYTGEDLMGLTVEHNPSRLNSFMPTILTLKDTNVLDTETGDVLVNVNIIDYEKYEENVKNKKKGVHYDPVQCEDEDFYNPPSLLPKYDDDKKNRFVIGSSGQYDLAQERMDEQMRSANLGKRISIPEQEARVANDYYTTEELQVRLKTKRKRKIRTNTRTNTKIAAVKIEATPEDIKPKKEEGELVEEDNNNSTLAKRRKATASASLQKERTEYLKSLADSDDDEMDFRPNLVYSEIKQTISNPRMRNEIAASKRSKPRVVTLEELLCNSGSDNDSAPITTGLVMSSSSASTDQIFGKLKAQQDFDASRVSNVRETPVVVLPPLSPKKEVVEIEEQAQSSGWQPEDKITSMPNVVKKSIKPLRSSPPPKKELKLMDGVLGDEVQLNQGIYSALLLAKNKGYLDRPTEETRLSNPKNNSLKAKHYYEEKIRYDDIDLKAPRRERYSGPVSTFQDKKDYVPKIKLEYHDEFGRPQELKEAFRTLSHRFHGKTSGKIKCEKRITRYVKEVEQGSLVGDVAMKSVDKQYSKMKEDKKFCVPLSGKNAIIPSALKKPEKKAKASPK